MKRSVLLLALMTFTACMSVWPVKQEDRPGISTIYAGAKILYGSELKELTNSSVAVVNGVISAVGPAEDIARKFPGAIVVDVSGATILPGLVDAHAHIYGLGEQMDQVNLIDTTSLEQVLQRVTEKSAQLPAGEWVLGRGWDETRWPGKMLPSAADLDRVVGDRPVFIRRIDGHAAVASSAALRIFGIDRNTPDPAGGKIARDGEGNPTGILIDNAKDLYENRIPKPSIAALKMRLTNAMNVAVSKGLTGVHEPGVAPGTTIQDVVTAYKELADEGKMPLRVYLMLNNEPAVLQDWFARGPLMNYGDRLTIRSVKVYSDGALGSRGAALLEPYSDDPGNRGLPQISREDFSRIARGALQSGFQLGTHAIGDGAARLVIEAYEAAGVKPEHRFRIEHLQVVALEDFDRLARSQIIASMQPTHATSDMRWAEQRVGPDRIRGAYAWRTVLDRKIPLAFGSDFPVEEVSPFHGLYAAVTRQDLEGNPPGGWRAEERLRLDEAIRAFTTGAAYAAFEEKSRGYIAPGMAADFTIVDGDFLAQPVSAMPHTKVRYTVVGGKIVYEGK